MKNSLAEASLSSQFYPMKVTAFFKFIFFSSLFLNLVLLAGMVFTIHRLGGWKYLLQRLNNPIVALYEHRKQLFEQLPTQNGCIIFLGDSQIAHCEWQELVGGDTATVLNRGIAGDYVDGVWARLDEVLRHKPSKIYLLVGVNDLLFQKPLPAIEARYRDIVQRIRRESPNTALILESLLPVNNDVKNTGVTNTQIQNLNARILQIARDYALQYLDLYTPLTDANGNLATPYTSDGIHLNGKGYKLVKSEK